MLLNQLFSKKLILFLSDIITGNSVKGKLDFLLDSDKFSKEQIVDFQNKRLQLLIKHAYDTVPYYQNLMNVNGLKPQDIHGIKDLHKLPLLTKSIIKEEGLDRFSSKGFPAAKTMKQSSSGSTGEPLFYTTTKEAYSMNLAANLRGWYWMGYSLGDKYIKLSQNPRKAPLKRLQDFFSNNLYLATNPLVDNNFEFILHQVEKFEPKIIRCYPDPLLMLARYKLERRSCTFTPHAITTTGNTLFPETRKEIEDAFGCKIFDSYSCEGNSTVFECPTHTGYHSAEEYGISEVIDKGGNPVSNGIGKLISTDLWNLAHPFIRYDTQDLVEIDSEPCACGRSHLKIKRIIGRDNDIIETPKNRFIVHNFTSFFSRQDLPTFGKIEKFQVRKFEHSVVFNLVVNEAYDSEAENFLINYWEKEMGMKIEVSLKKEIELTSSGKHKFIING